MLRLRPYKDEDAPIILSWCYKAAGFHEAACEENDTFKILGEEWKRIVMEIAI